MEISRRKRKDKYLLPIGAVASMTSMAVHLEGGHFRSGNMTIDEPAVALPILTGLWSRMLSRPALIALCQEAQTVNLG